MNNRIEIVGCPVCNSSHHTPYMVTNALMHKPNDEKFHFHQCENCIAVFLTDPVQEAYLPSYYTNNYLPYKGAAAWGKFHSFVENSQQQLDKKRMVFVAKATKGRTNFTILDVGCGNPTFLKLVQQKLGATCTGIDFSDNGWQSETAESLTLIKTTVADFEPEQQYDVITLWHYLEHDYNLQKTVAKLHKLLAPGGQLIIEVPDYRSWSAHIQKQHWQGWHSPRHLTLLAKPGFEALFTAAKWRINKHLRYGTLDAFTLWWLGRMERKRINWANNMEAHFWPLVALKITSWPIFLFEKLVPMGIQLVVVEKK